MDKIHFGIFPRRPAVGSNPVTNLIIFHPLERGFQLKPCGFTFGSGSKVMVFGMSCPIRIPVGNHEGMRTFHHRENAGTLGMVPLINYPLYTLYSGHLLGISPCKGLLERSNS